MLKIQKNPKNDKKLKILIANSSKVSYDLMQDASSLMNVEFILSKNFPYPNNEAFIKNNDFEKLNYFSKFIRQAKKNDLDAIFIPSYNSNQIDVVVKNNGEYWVLNYEQIAILILDYLFANKKENFKSENYFVATTVNISEIIERICNKHNVVLYEDRNFFNNVNKYNKKLLFYFDEENRFLINSNISNSSDIFQTQILLTEVLNYHKTQTRDLNFVLNNFVNKYSKKVIMEKKIILNHVILQESLKKIINKKNIGKTLISSYEYINNFENENTEKEYILKIILSDDSTILFNSYLYSGVSDIFVVAENEYIDQNTNKKINKHKNIFKNLKKNFLI